MQQALQRSSLVPRGFVVESAYYEGDKAVIVVRASGRVGLTVSRRVHGKTRRLPVDANRADAKPGVSAESQRYRTLATDFLMR